MWHIYILKYYLQLIRMNYIGTCNKIAEPKTCDKWKNLGTKIPTFHMIPFIERPLKGMLIDT